MDRTSWKTRGCRLPALPVLSALSALFVLFPPPAHAQSRPFTSATYRLISRTPTDTLPAFLQGGVLFISADTLTFALKDNLVINAFRVVADDLEVRDVPGGTLPCGPMPALYRIRAQHDTLAFDSIDDQCEGRANGMASMRLVPGQ
jgi:hypothetical protein